VRRVLELAILLTLSLGIFLVVSEVALRIYLNRNISFDVEMGRYARILEAPSENPRIRHRQRPDTDVRLMGVPVRTNSVGLRDAPITVERDDRWRVVILGDSLTFGWGVPVEQTFATLLESRLSEHRPTEVINFGHVNYNTVQQVNLFIEAGLEYQPDQVVLFYFINDAEPVPAPSHPSWLGSLRIATFYGSRLNALRARFDESAGYRDYYAAFYDEDAPGWRDARDAFVELRTVCSAHEISLQVVVLPELHELEHYPFTREHELLGAFLHANEIPFVDLTASFADEADPASLWVAVDDAHPNARGHERIATLSLDFIANP
jgi:lysophospholipase L1-like esterase